MTEKKKTKSVQLDIETTERLDKIGTRSDTYDSLIRKLLDFWEVKEESE